MKTRATILSLGALATIAGASAFSISNVNAQGNADSLASKISQKFNLSEGEVKSVFEEHHSEMKANREEKRQEHLQQLQDDGIINEEQRNYLNDHFSSRPDFKAEGVDREAAKEQMQERRQELEDWANEQGIDLEDIRPEHKGENMRRGGHQHSMMDNEASETDQ